jgi:acyl-CoA reductase-like NAD-dependent aldehyde dehydrogenase
MTIGGRAVTPEQTFGVINPATGSVFAQCPECSPAQLDAAMESAARAFPGWRQDEARRRQVLKACAQAIRAHAEALGATQTSEQGMPCRNAVQEMQYAAIWLDVTADLPTPVDVLQDTDARRTEVRRKPLGVVGAITPWNFPILLAVWKIAPALLAGNTLVVKPSPYTPLATLQLGEVLREVVPPGVLNIVSGGDELGAQITRHPAVRKISFTGSVETGKLVAAAAAPDLKRTVLELGGNDPALVLDDVDPKVVAPKLFWSAFLNNGQVCIAIKRLYVHERVYQPLVEELATIARAIRLGDGQDPATELGPLNNEPQLQRVMELVEDARGAGGQVIAGGERLDRPGYFYPPTLVTGVGAGTRLVDEEQFGPALPIIPFARVDDALAEVNATHFGLGASVWTSDVARGTEIAAQLESGTAWVNQHMEISPLIPLGGAKWSGIGYQNGTWGLESFCELQVIDLAKGG